MSWVVYSIFVYYDAFCVHVYIHYMHTITFDIVSLYFLIYELRLVPPAQ